MAKIEFNPTKWTQEERQEFLDKGFRTRREEEFPLCSYFTRPTDYAHDLKRGEVKFTPDWKNYSFHTVIIEPKTEIRGYNFAQATPNTVAILCDGELKLIECNLSNVALDARWELEGCLTSQSWIVKNEKGEEDRQFICAHPSELKDNEQEPSNVVKERDY